MSKVVNVKIAFGRAFLQLNHRFFSNSPYKVQRNKNHVIKTIIRHMAWTWKFTKPIEWRPEEITSLKLTKGYACFVVNRKITAPKNVVENIWQNAVYRVTVDGGTNRWRDFLLTHKNANQLKPPDYITGDFDSITEETSAYFNNPSIQRVHTPDENYTDFTKAIQVLEPFLISKEIKELYVFHDTSGRMDHIMGNIQTLYQAPQHLNVYLICGTSLTWLLKPGLHNIQIPKELVDGQRWCALLPVGGKATVTSIGLKWDLNEDILEFGSGIVSSSNSYKGQEVHIQTSDRILWSMGVFNFHDD